MWDRATLLFEEISVVDLMTKLGEFFIYIFCTRVAMKIAKYLFISLSHYTDLPGTL